MVIYMINRSKNKRKKLFAVTVTANYLLFAVTVTANYLLFAVTVTANNLLFTVTVLIRLSPASRNCNLPQFSKSLYIFVHSFY